MIIPPQTRSFVYGCIGDFPELSQQEIHALRGVVATLEGRKTRPRKDRLPPKNEPTPKAPKS